MSYKTKQFILVFSVFAAFLSLGFAISLPLNQNEPVDEAKNSQFQDYTSPKTSPVLSPEEAVSHKYLAGDWQGYIAIFRLPNLEAPEFISDIPLATLTRQDAEKIKDGIELFTDEELTQLLEDFGS